MNEDIHSLDKLSGVMPIPDQNGDTVQKKKRMNSLKVCTKSHKAIGERRKHVEAPLPTREHVREG
jgi:hypothetical protein